MITVGTVLLGVEIDNTEDITIGHDSEEDADYIYLGDIGNENLVRDHAFVWRFKEPNVTTDFE